MIELTEIYSLLFQFGATANYVGTKHTAIAIQLCLKDSSFLLGITKQLYPEVAVICNTTSARVERNIRTVVNMAWSNNKNLLETIVGRPLFSKPTASTFISFLVFALSK